jgi:hypothetical protein
MMFDADRMELLRLRVGLGPRTMAQARWAVVMRRESDGFNTISHLGEWCGSRAQCIAGYSAQQPQPYKWPNPSHPGNGVLTCERVVVAFNYREKDGP